MQNYDINPELLSGFIYESLEGLEPLDTLLIELEKNPADSELVNTIFRPVHSIKGSSAFFGLLKIKELAHKMEDLLDNIRQKKIKISKDVISVLLPGLDLLRSMFDNIRGGTKEIDDEASFQKTINLIIEISEKKYDPFKEDKVENSATFLKDLIFKLEDLRRYIQPDLTYFIDDAEKIITKIMPEETTSVLTSKDSDVCENRELAELLKTTLHLLETPIEDVLDTEISKKIKKKLLKLQQAADSPETKSIISESVEIYDAFMKDIGFDSLLQKTLTENINILQETGKWKTEKIIDADSETTEKKKSAAQEASKERRSGIDRRDVFTAAAEKTMRVSEKNIDSFLSYVSELVVVEEMFNYLQKKLVSSSASRSIADDFKRVIETFGNLSGNLRKSILSIRTVPVKSVLQKAPRIIHDIAAAGNKKVDVKIEENNILIDKSYIEMLDAPFTHIIRNAVDHGIESEKERISAGKPPKGNILITMQEFENNMELTISDDGKGLNYGAITKKAEEMEIIAKGQILEENAVVDLLFVSGVSTAEKVTDVSGRGVGMDVAKKNIEAAGGKIMIESKQGQGSTFTISLPKSVSTQIMEGFLVRTGNDIYVMPMELIGESFALKTGDISSVKKKGEMLLRRGGLFPILRLGAKLNKNYKKSPENICSAAEEKIAISININSKQYALCVDEIVGVQKVVVKNIEALPIKKKLFDGAAMLGDGSVAMIIGADGLSRLTA